MNGPQRWLMHAAFVALAVSGTAYAVMKYLMVGDDPFSTVGHPLQPQALALHVLAAPVGVFAFGLIFRDHILTKFRQRNGTRGRRSGIAAMLLLLPMTASGYLLPTLTDETLRRATVIVHLATGAAYAGLYLTHVVVSLRRRLAADTMDGPVPETSSGLSGERSSDRSAPVPGGLAMGASAGPARAGAGGGHSAGSRGAARGAGIVLALAMAGLSSIGPAHAAAPCIPLERARSVMGTIARVIVCFDPRASDGDDAAVEPGREGPSRSSAAGGGGHRSLSESEAAQAAAEALDAIARVDAVMSLYRPDSDLSRLNREGHPGPVRLDMDLVRLLAESKRIAAETGGRFDVTIKPLMDYYGFYAGLGFGAGEDGLDGALGRVGIDGLRIDEDASSASFDMPGMGIDLGGIAKGFALDRAAAALERHGVGRAVLDLGRNLMFIGRGPLADGGWPAAVVDPLDPDALSLCLDVPPGAISTSARFGLIAQAGRTGDDRHAGTVDQGPAGTGHRGGIGHVLDPARGAVESRVLQATVWSTSATRADALSTAVLLLAEDPARRLLTASGEMALLFRQGDGPGGYDLRRLGASPTGFSTLDCAAFGGADRGPLGPDGGSPVSVLERLPAGERPLPSRSATP